MTFTTDETTRKPFEDFQQFDTDTKLGILWFGYLDLKQGLNPADASSAEVTSSALFNSIKALPQQEQLQAQRDIVNRVDNDITRDYKALSSSGKLDVWLKLAQGMEEGTIIQVPSDYQLPSETQGFIEEIKQLDFEQRVNFMRSAVVEMGAK